MFEWFVLCCRLLEHTSLTWWEDGLRAKRAAFQADRRMLFLPPTSDRMLHRPPYDAIARRQRSDFMAGVPRLTARGLGAGSRAARGRFSVRGSSSALAATCRGKVQKVHG